MPQGMEAGDGSHWQDFPWRPLPGPMGDGAEQISVCLTVLLHFPLPRAQGQNLDSRTSVQ